MNRFFTVFFICVLLLCIVPVCAEDLPKSASGRLGIFMQEHPERFLGYWSEDGVLHVGLTTDDPDIIAEYDALLNDYAPEVVFELFPYSFNQLEELQNTINELLYDSNPYGIISTSILLQECAVQVISKYENNDILTEKLNEICAEHDMAADAVFYVEDPSYRVHYLTDADADPSRQSHFMNRILLVIIPAGILILAAGTMMLVKKNRAE